MAESLENNALFAQLGMLSGDRVLAPFGKAMLERETDLRKTRSARKSSIGKGFIMDSETGEVVRDPGYAEYEKGRDELEQEQRRQLQGDMMERLGYSADLRSKQPRYSVQETEGGVAPVQYNPNAPGGARVEPTIPVRQPIAPADRQKAAEAERLAHEALDLYQELQKTQGAISSPKDIATHVTSKLPLVGGPASRVVQEGMYSPKQLEIKTRGARFEQNLSNLAAGLALTGYEIEQRDKWSPFASGISQEESFRRLGNINRDFNTRRDTILRANQVQPEIQIYPRGSAEDLAAQEQWVIGDDGKPKRIK